MAAVSPNCFGRPALLRICGLLDSAHNGHALARRLPLGWIAPGAKGTRPRMEVFVQAVINGMTLGSIYGLIAIGYTMVFGISGW